MSGTIFVEVMKMDFSQTNFNFASYPANMMVYDYTYGEFQAFYGAFWNLLTNRLEIEGKDLTRFRAFGPANVFVGKSSSSIFLGIETGKAVHGQIVLVTFKRDYENIENFVSEIDITAKLQLGIDVDLSFVEIPKSFWDAFKPFFKQESESDKKFEFSNQGIMNWCVSQHSEGNETPSSELPKAIAAVWKYIENEEQIMGVLQINPIFKARDLTVNKDQVFCVLPFTDERIEIFDEVIKPYLEQEHQLTVIRSGKVINANQNIMETIWTYINTAGFILADISNQNPNVFYELGICHTLGKKVVILCDEESYQNDYNGRLPFDVAGMTVYFYKNKGNGMQKLKDSLDKYVESYKTGKAIII